MEPKSITGKSERTRIKAGRRFLEDSLTTFSVKNTRFGPWTHTHNTQTQQSTKRLNMAGHPVWTKKSPCVRVWTDEVSKKRRNDTCFHLACHTPKTVLVHLMIRQRAGVCPSFQHKKTKKKKEWGCRFGNKQEKVQVAAGRVGVFLFVNHKLGHTAVPARLQTTAKSLNGHPVIQD